MNTPKKVNRILSLFLAFVFVIGMVAVFPVPAGATGTETLAAWKFATGSNVTSASATSGAFQNSSIALSDDTSFSTTAKAVAGVDITNEAFGSCWSPWAATATKYWKLTLYTQGYKNIQLSFNTYSTSTGPNSIEVKYSTDGTNFQSFATPAVYTVPITNSVTDTTAVSLDLSEFDNSTKPVYIGVFTSGSTGGNHRLANVKVSGESITAATKAAAPTADPSPTADAVAEGAQVTLSSATTGAAIYYTTDGTTPTSSAALYSAPIALNFGSNSSITITAYASASGYTDSAPVTFTYSKAITKTPTANPVPGAYDTLSEVALTSDDGAEIWYTTDESTPEKDGAKSVKYDSATGITGLTLPVTISAIAYKTGCLESTVGTFVYTQKSTDTNYNFYFGQLHSHTTLSDGAGTVEEAFEHAKAVPGLDFLAVTDHSNSFPNALSSGGANINDPKSDASFLSGRSAATAATDSTFVGIYGYEMSWSGSTGGFGHINTFDTVGYESRNSSYFTANTTDPATNGLNRYYQGLKTATGTQDGGTPISQLNHPGTTFGDFLDFKFYDSTLDPYVQLVEVGNGEGAMGSGGYFQSYDYYTRALDQGWHVAPSNNQDNHKGNWGDSNTARTVVLAKQLTMADIFDAIRNRRVYATEDETLKINYTLGGKEMGYIFPDGTAPTGTVPIHVTLTTPDASRIAGGTVSVVTDYGVIPVSVPIADNSANGATLTTADGTTTFDWTVDVPATSSYYYIQVIENRTPASSTSKYRAVTAPVWIGTTTKAGIRATTCSDLVPLGGVETTISSTLFNNESDTLTVNSLTYTLANGTVINTSAGPITITTGGTYTYSFPYTPSLGTQVINVTASCNLGSTAKKFADTLTIKAGDPSVMTFIGIDASKYGEYVAGNYANCYNNFLKVTNANNVVVKVLTTITPDSLKGCTAAIIPTPARKSGTYTPKDGSPAINYTAQTYTTEELQAYADFAAQGGSFIIAGIADYGDGTKDGPNHASKQLNEVLQSIGADSRISDDEVVDFDSNLSSTSYRLAFNYSEMNPDSQYTADVKSNQTYSFYSGCSVIPGTTNKTEWIVKGHPTTFSIDADGDTGIKVNAKTKPSGDLSQTDLARGIVVGQGNVYALVADQLPGGGKAFIGSSTFFSDFEISDFDSGNNLALSNMMVTWNIIKDFVKPIPTSSIAVARAAEIGRVFKVQGTVASCTNGFDPTHGFFDCMYIQDATGGVNVFGITKDMMIPVGTKVTVTGTVQEYNGDIELIIASSSSVVAAGTGTAPAPLALSTTGARDLTKNGGLLAKIQGTVTKLAKTSGLLSEVWVKDTNDTSEFGARLFIDGYIGGTEPSLAVGDTVTGIGFVSASDDGMRLRVRDRAEIVKLNDGSTVYYPTSNSYYAHISGSGTSGSLLVSVDQITGRASVKIDPQQGNPLSGGKNVTVKLPAIPNVSTYSINIRSDYLSSGSSGSLMLSTGAGNLTLPSGMLSNIAGLSGKDAQITIGKANKSALSANAQAQIGDRPLITLSLTLGGQQTEWNNPNAPVTVSIPYTPTAAELANPDGIVVWYIDGSGNLVSIPNGHYDPSTGMMTFKTTHFSYYAVGYNSASFNDVTANEWYFNAVSFIAARNITTGTGNGNFSPAINLTRADFLVMLMKAYSIAPDTNPTENFSDAGSTYYTGYLAAAKMRGISNGVGNNMFTPENKITRQEMFTLLYNALKAIGQLPQCSSDKTLSDFSDASNIASWAHEAMTQLVQTGTISGSDGKLSPTGTTTRAEMAQVLYNLLSK